MIAFLLRRIGAGVVVMFVVSVLVFVGVRAAPGDPATVLAGGDPAAVPAIRHEYRLDQPLPVQYARWAWLALHGDLGHDERGLAIVDTVTGRIPLTLELALLSLLVAAVIGIPAGVLAAVRHRRATDRVVSATGVVALSVPSFWLGLLAILWFAVDLHWLPASGYVTMRHPLANLRHMLLPCVVLGIGFAAVQMRQMRSAMTTALAADYVRTARAKGLNELRVTGHAVRNSLLTNTTLLGLEFGALVSGAAIVETVFGIPGFGALGVDAVSSRDYPMIEAIVLVTALAWVLVNVAIDVAYLVLDPRVRTLEAPA